MPEIASFSSRLRKLTSELAVLDRELKSQTPVNAAALRDLREVVDSIRMTAWTVSELMKAQAVKKDPDAVLTLLTAERLRRVRQMMADLVTDLEHDGERWPSHSIDNLQESVNHLRERLGIMAFRRNNGRKPQDDSR